MAVWSAATGNQKEKGRGRLARGARCIRCRRK